MRQTALWITAREPLAFPQSKPGTQFRASLPYVPGAAMFGAIGQALADLGRFDPAVLLGLRCRNAYPAYDGDVWTRPLPATAIHPKGEEEQLEDSLIQRVCWERQRPAALLFAPVDSGGRPHEGARQRFYTVREGKPVLRQITQRIHTRVAINRRRATAEDRQLYSFFTLSERMYGSHDHPAAFAGSIASVQVEHDDEWQQLLALAMTIGRLGARQTTGIGAVTVEETTWPGGAGIRERVETLTQRFRQQIDRYVHLGGAPWELGEHQIFTVNLLSDTILLRDGWLPTQELTPELLRTATRDERAGYPGIDAVLVRAFTTTRIVGGWNVLWQRPKETHVAVQYGGVYLFESQAPLNDADYAALERLEIDGIGERRPEGFGQVRICDEFHLMDVGGTA